MEPIEFKYHAVNEQGYECGFFASKGALTDEALTLDGVVFPLNCIYQVFNRYSRVSIVYAADNGQALTYTIAPRGGVDRKIKTTIDRLCSYRWSEHHHAQLEKEGKGAAFRTAKCPACLAVVDLSGFAETPQFYCPYCEALLPTDQNIEPRWLQYRLCDRCRYYGFSTRYTTTYVILNMIRWQEHYSCHVCMRHECWKMLLVNLLPPFIGEIWAIYNTIRAYGAGMMDSYLPELDSANALGQKGRAEEVKALYDVMLQRAPVQAGLRHNLALAYWQAGEWEECLENAQHALRDCSNYTPAGTLVSQALTNLNRTEEAERFLNTWGMPATTSSAIPLTDSEHIQAQAPKSTDQRIRDVGQDAG